MKSPKRAPRKRILENQANPVQRLLIVHEGLPEICGGLDEGASAEELSEHILYYYDANLHFLNGADESSHSSDEAIHFAGLSSALRSLPCAMDGSDDCTREIHLGTATLVFVPLEEDIHAKVIAVVQVARTIGSSSSCPIAIHAAIQRCHNLFCILRRGGIHHTLSCNTSTKCRARSERWSIGFVNDTDNDEPPPELSLPSDVERQQLRSMPFLTPEITILKEEENNVVFPGMEQLYIRRKEARKLGEMLDKTSELLTVKRNSLQNQLIKVETTIRQMLEDLPISMLRIHLMEHFNEFLVDIGAAAFAGVAFRCLIESVPEPAPSNSDGISDQHFFSTPSIFASIQLGRSINALIHARLENYTHASPFLLGASSFFRGQLLYTHTLTTMPGSNGSTVEFLHGLSLSNKTASVIMRYMASFRQKIEHAVQSSSKNPMHEQQPAFLRNVRFSRMYINPTKDEASIQEIDADFQNNKLGRFLTSPPLSMLYVSDEILEVSVASFGKVWTPVVHIPIDDPNTQDFWQLNVALYEVGDYSFLLYIDRGSQEDLTNPQNDTTEDGTHLHNVGSEPFVSQTDIPMSPLAELLEHVAASISESVTEVRTDAIPMYQPDSEFHSDPVGQHVVFVDRSIDQLELYSKASTPNESEIFGRSFLLDGEIKGMSFRQRQGTTIDDDIRFRNGIIRATPGMDCRHSLTSRLSEDVVLAFDDMMSAVQAARDDDTNKGFDKHGDGGGFELCTYIAQGWMWAYAHGDKELYIFFDCKKYSTITQVEISANEIRHAFFHENPTIG